MAFPHRTFLLWLVYIAIVIFSFGVFSYLNLPRMILKHDHSHLSIVLIALYALAEVLAGRQAWRISRENLICDQTLVWLEQQRRPVHVRYLPGGVDLSSENYTYHLPASEVARHLQRGASGDDPQDHAINLELTEQHVYETATIGEFIGDRIVWLGIFTTILGVIMAFWPMIDGITLDAMKANLGGFFGGIAVAFIPTALSFLFKIYLDVNTAIIISGSRSLIAKIHNITELVVSPSFHRDGRK